MRRLSVGCPAVLQYAARLCSSEKSAPPSDAGDDDVVTPWAVTAKGPKGVNYDRVVTKFKAEKVDGAVCQRLTEAIAKRAAYTETKPTPLHHFFTRGIAFSHRDLAPALDDVEASLEPGKFTAYLYTGRGPSATSMHVGHVIPFMLTQYLQAELGLPLVIQITDDEKFLFRDVPFEGEKANELITSNIKDIIAFGFNPKHTFIFRNTEYMGEMYSTVLPIQRALTTSAVKNTFGIQDSDNIGKVAFPATQAAPCFDTAFKRVLQHAGERPMRCIIPCAIDQDPFFVLTRNVAPRLKRPSPALLHTKFLPALKGLAHKMSSSAEQNGVITLHDTDAQVFKKMRKAFSGGSGTLEEMRDKGADFDVDVAYQFIKFFCKDEQLFREVTERYGSGTMNSGEVKTIAAEVVIRDVLTDWRERRAAVTDCHVEQFCGVRNILN